VRALSQEIGYTNRGRGTIKVPSLEEITRAFESLGFDVTTLRSAAGQRTELAASLIRYFVHRAHVLESFVEPRLMDKDRVPGEYAKIRRSQRHFCPTPMNKQKGAKKQVAYLTAIINMLIEENIGSAPCTYDPRTLTCVTQGGAPLRTLSRRVDGAFPNETNPIAIWEVKEYYYTTTFGSRVADGVYETLLDGMELQELRDKEGIHVEHYLMLDGHYTWWDCGRSYLCRVIDMLHMGYVDEVLFGHEVTERLPQIAREWAEKYRQRRL
jgi:hypothetical protein